MQVIIYSTILKEKDIDYVQEFFDILHEEGVNAYVYRPYLKEVREKIQLKQDVGEFDGYVDFSLGKHFDCVITLGGDGTILAAATAVRDSNVPIMGINLGRLGFLSSIEKKRIKEAIAILKNGRFTLDERYLLSLESNEPLFGDTPFALNDCTLLKRDTSSMVTIHTYINGSYLNTYWADGIIIATPTGSTGYSLSCGGPIIFPRSNNFVITPVAPHNLTARPVVIDDSSVVSFEIEGRADNFLCTLDSRFEVITDDVQLAVRKCDFTVKFIQLPDTDFPKTIRQKLAWGKDSRN